MPLPMITRVMSTVAEACLFYKTRSPVSFVGTPYSSDALPETPTSTGISSSKLAKVA